MTVDFNGKNNQSKTIFILDIKVMLTMIWYLNMEKLQMLMEVVELFWWEKCGILVLPKILKSNK